MLKYILSLFNSKLVNNPYLLLASRLVVVVLQVGSIAVVCSLLYNIYAIGGYKLVFIAMICKEVTMASILLL